MTGTYVPHLKTATEMLGRVRKLGEIGPQTSWPVLTKRSETEQIRILQQQVDELAAALGGLASYIIDRDGIKLD